MQKAIEIIDKQLAILNKRVDLTGDYEAQYAIHILETVKQEIEAECSSTDDDKLEFETIEPHTCPFKEEMNNDHDTLCTCDPEQTYQCAMDV